MTNKTGVPGTLKTFAERTGGYENFQYNTKSPQDNNPDVMLTEEEAEQMLNDANDFLQNIQYIFFFSDCYLSLRYHTKGIILPALIHLLQQILR